MEGRRSSGVCCSNTARVAAELLTCDSTTTNETEVLNMSINLVLIGSYRYGQSADEVEVKDQIFSCLQGLAQLWVNMKPRLYKNHNTILHETSRVSSLHFLYIVCG